MNSNIRIIKIIIWFLLIILTRLNAQTPKMVLPIGHTSNIRTVDISPDGKLLVTASYDNTAKLWDVQTGILLTDLSSHTGGLNLAIFSPDGKQILTASHDGLAILWDVRNGTMIREFKGHSSSVISAKFSYDGKRIVTASFDSTAKVWDVMTGNLLLDLKGHTHVVSYAEFSHDGEQIVTASWDKTASLWDANTGGLLLDLKGNNGFVYSAHFNHDGSKIVTACRDNYAKIWDTRTGKVLAKFKGMISLSMQYANFSNDGKKMISSYGRGAKIWDVKTGKKIARLKVRGSLKEYSSTSQFAEFSFSGNKVVTFTLENQAMIWDGNSGKLITTLYGHHNSINWAIFTKDEKYVITCSDDQTAKLWDASTGRLKMEFKGHTKDLWKVDFAPIAKDSINGISNTYIIYNDEIKLRDAENGNILAVMSAHKMWQTSVNFSADGSKITTASYDKTACIWNATTGALIARLSGHTKDVNQSAFSPDGKWVVTASLDNTAKVWDANSGKLKFALVGHKNWVTSAQFDPNGTKIVTVSDDHTARIWDANTGKMLFNLIGHESELQRPVFSPPTAEYPKGGANLITYSDDSFALLWDMQTGKLIAKLHGHQGRIASVVYRFDGKLIMTGSEDSTIKIWDALNGQLLKTITEIHYRIGDVVFSPPSISDENGGNRILTYSFDTANIILWDYQSNKKIADLQGYWPEFSRDGEIIVTTGNENEAYSYDGKNGKLFAKLKDHSNNIQTFKFMPDGKKVITSSYDHTSKVWDLKTGKLYNTFFVIDSIDHFNQTPEGYYQCTPNAAKLIHYTTPNLSVISFEQLDVKYNRPDKVLQAMGCKDTSLINSYRQAYYKRIKKLNIDTLAFQEGYSVPASDFKNRKEIEYEQKTEMLSLKIQGMDSIYLLDRFNVWINEVPIFGMKGISLKSRNSNQIDTTITVKLSQGENRIETSVTNVNGTESYRMPLLVKYIPVKFQPGMHYFIGIGIDKFQDTRYNLNYSTKDIRDLCLKFKEKYGNDIVIDTLFNANVTIENVKALKQRLMNTNVNDQVVISYSGHGLLSNQYDYYLSTFAVNFEKPEEYGLPYDDLENLLDSIPARQKLLLIDACHSGEVDKEEALTISNTAIAGGLKGSQLIDYPHTEQVGLKNSFELMQSLFVNVGKNTGTIIISAAAGNQFALESGNLQNGVFTYTILEAFDKYPTLKISELKTRVGLRVEQLTDGLQKPTYRNETISVDWNVW